jgi:hypothetical protein
MEIEIIVEAIVSYKNFTLLINERTCQFVKIINKAEKLKLSTSMVIINKMSKCERCERCA